MGCWGHCDEHGFVVVGKDGTLLATSAQAEDDETAFKEGKLIYRRHRQRERSPKAVEIAKQRRMSQTGDLRSCAESLQNWTSEPRAAPSSSSTSAMCSRTSTSAIWSMWTEARIPGGRWPRLTGGPGSSPGADNPQWPRRRLSAMPGPFVGSPRAQGRSCRLVDQALVRGRARYRCPRSEAA